MHFTNKSKERGKAISKRVLSVLLSVLMLASILYVGNVATVEASAVDANTEVYICFNTEGNLWWFGAQLDSSDNQYKPNAELGAWCWDGSSSEYNRLQFVAMTSTYALYRFTPTISFTNFNVHRWWGTDAHFSTLDKATKWEDIVLGTTVGHQETATLSASGYTSDKCMYVKSNSGSVNDSGIVSDATIGIGNMPKNLTPTTSDIKGGNDYSAGVGYDVDGTVKLLPVQAKFYDYLTDYELAHGWRCNDDYETSRTYRHRIPYIRWNKYISDLTGGEGGDWAYPLYFGNFTTTWGSFTEYPYGTLRDKHIYPASTSGATGYYGTTEGHLRHENQISNYTGNEKLYNFSIYANDSEPIAKVNNNNYNGCVQGLVSSTLTGDQLYMKTKTGTILSPYFSHTSSNSQYINTVSTMFPMRINSDNNGGVFDGKSTKYTTYEFDSKGKTSGASDNVYFDYNSDGIPNKIYYSQNDSVEVTDAYKSLGGNTGNDHRGFFPFDNGGIGHDYGFGMRLDIPFNLTEDGNVISVDADGMYHKTNIPMEFDFEGDDDVWVFVDGTLALDLGGDHGNTRGKINFSLNKNTSDGVSPRTGTPLTGAFVLKSSPSYGSTEYQGTGSATALSLSSDSYNETGDKYNPTNIHTLTVFYMERGLVESNLRMSFSISPLANKLTVKKEVNTEDVNTQLVSLLGIDDESFTVKLDPYTKKGDKVVYTKNGSETTEDLPANNTIALKDGDYAVFENQFELESQIGITETVSSGNDYTYTTSYKLIDEYQEEFEKPYTPETGEGTAIPTFIYKTKSSKDKAPTLYRAEFINKVDTAKVTVSKKYNGKDSGPFTFGVSVKLPNGTVKALSDITVAKNGSTDITGIPKGSEVTVTEKTTGYNVSYKIGTGSSTNGNTATITNLTADTTVAFKNKDTPNEPGKYTPKAKKYVSGAAASASQLFSFTLTPWNVSSNSASGTAETKQNSAGNITFDERTFDSEGTFWFKIEETANSDYTIDTTSPYSNVYYLKCVVSLSGHVYSVTPTYYKSDRTTTVTEANVIFNNIPVIRKGYLKVTKRDSNGDNADFTGTQFTVYKVTGNNAEPAENAESTVLTLTNSTSFNDVNSKYEAYVASGELDLGWYMVVETKAPNNYELSGEKKWIEVKASNTADAPAEVVFVNKPSTDLPTTGGIGVVIFITIGVVLIGAAILLLKPKKAVKK